MSETAPIFADLDPAQRDYAGARAAILPIPYERTTCWGKGTRNGPRAILEASHHVELYDPELDAEPCSSGIATLPYLAPASDDLVAALDEIRSGAGPCLEEGKFLVALGGEHAITAPLVRAAAAVHGELGVVQFDAHGDLRQEYEGTPFSHACVMRRLVEEGFPTLAVGIRSLCGEEAGLIRRRALPVVWGAELERLRPEGFRRLLQVLPEKIYLTFDLDFFDPALVPATGTPVPGGGGWYPTLALLRALFAARRVVAMDVVELAPIPGQPASDFVAASLIYKCLGFLQASG